MTVNNQLLEFLDGALAPDEEAELLHRLSVSPERREILRSFMHQTSVFAADRARLAVPYPAEEGLWARLSLFMPPVAGEFSSGALTETIAASSASTGLASFFGRISSPVFQWTVGILLFASGLSLGYFSHLANLPDSDHPISLAAQNFQLLGDSEHGLSAGTAPRSPTSTNSMDRPFERGNAMNTVPEFNPAFMSSNLMMPIVINTSIALPNGPQGFPKASQAVTTDEAANSGLAVMEPPPLVHSMIGGENKPIFFKTTIADPPERSFLQRFEFSFSESFGRQYPNSLATNVSLPLITNSSIAAFFQILPRSNALWLGIAAGTANITHKKLFTVVGNPLDPSQQMLASDYVHVQSNWTGAFLQYRIPFMALADITVSGGYGLSSSGKMAIGELGLHYDATREVGFQVGLRGTRLSYDLNADKADAIQSSKGSLVVPRGVLDVPASYNIEVNTGLYFHF